LGKDVPQPLDKRLVVENRFGRVAPLPEGAAPSREPADLSCDVGHHVLHELRKVSSGRTDQEMKVVRLEAEREDLDSHPARRPGQYAAEDLIRLA
jgi:hypothetical protein